MVKTILKSIVSNILILEAKFVLKKFQPKIIAITGSVGKTSTKDAIYGILSGFFYVRKSDKSFNSEIGVPLTILGLENAWKNPVKWLENFFKGLSLVFLPQHYPEWLVLEIGADRPKDIKRVAGWIKPDITVITKLAEIPAHIEFFKSPEEIAQEKSFLVKSLKKNGALILNMDDSKVADFRSLAAGKKVLTFGITNKNADIQASNYEIHYDVNGKPMGINFKINSEGNCFPVPIEGVLGIQHVYPVLAALALGKSLELNIVEEINYLRNYRTPPGRMRLVPGIKESTIIDDTYNSSPVALTEALNTLRDIKTTGRKIAVLGDMLELGKYSEKAHRAAGIEAAKSSNILITVGIRGKAIAEEAENDGMSEKNILHFDNSNTAGAHLKNLIAANDIILVKGSQRIRMEKVVLAIMAEPQKAPDLLVRQEREWKRK